MKVKKAAKAALIHAFSNTYKKRTMTAFTIVKAVIVIVTSHSPKNYFLIAAMPGSSLPSMASSKAPPPEET